MADRAWTSAGGDVVLTWDIDQHAYYLTATRVGSSQHPRAPTDPEHLAIRRLARIEWLDADEPSEPTP